MKSGASKGVRGRIFLVAFFYLALFTIVLLRAYQLQVFKGDELGERADRQHLKKIALAPVRGKIFDRNGEELATNIEVGSVYVQPAKIANPKKAAQILAEKLGEDRREILEKLRARKAFVWLKRRTDLKTGDAIEALDIKGIGSIRESKRYYPNMDLAGHLLGFAGVDSQGLEGIELKYDGLIMGDPGFFIAERDALGRNIFAGGLNIKDSSGGSDVILTIDKTIQHITERELGYAVEKYKARGGMALVMEPMTGEVLAMAVRPAFNPNFFEKSSPADWRNRIITDTFEPGSTFKIFLAAGALDSGKVESKDIFFCENGRVKVYDRFIHDSSKHGWLTVENILKVSSNIGAYKIADKLGDANFYEYIRRFGFGEKTGIDLPGETSGLVRDVRKWSPVDFANVSFGQGISVTAMQLVAAISAVANGGYLMKPIIVKRIIGKDGESLISAEPVKVRRVISPAAAKKVTAILIRVISGEGTGVRAALEGYQVAGKTGTSQKYDFEAGKYSRDKYISSFIGFLPADAPRLAILVMLDEPKDHYYGGKVAAPVFRKIAEQSLAYMKIAPHGDKPSVKLLRQANWREKVLRRSTLDDIHKNDDFEKGDGISSMPDLRGMTLRETLVKMGLPPSKISGNGIVVEQSPMPGEAFQTESGYNVKLKGELSGDNLVL